MSQVERIEHADNSDFNRWLNSNGDNIVSINGYTFPPSETLYKMNYDQYLQALQEYLHDDGAIINIVYTDFPTPISYYIYQAEENYDNSHHRLDLLKSAWEALVFILFGLVVGEARHKSIPLKDVNVDLKDYYSDSLAKRLTIIENIFEYCQANNYQLSCFLLFSPTVISQLRDLNTRRNEFEHSFAATPDEQRILYNALFTEMLEALKKLRELRRVSLFRFHSVGEGGPLTPRCDVFNGHSLDGAKRPIIIPREDYDCFYPYFNPNTIFAHIDGENVFCVSPFIHFKKDPQDTHPRLTVYKKKLTGGKYLYSVIGQSGQIDCPKSVFEDRDNDLRRLVLGVGA